MVKTPYGTQDLTSTIAMDEHRVRCPVADCDTWVRRQRRTFRRTSEYCCPRHRIYVSPSTFEYQSALDNLLWTDADDLRLLSRLLEVKRESRMARERSEDALTWNVFRALEKADCVGSWVHELTSTPANMPSVVYWGSDPVAAGRWRPLEEARTAFGEDVARGTEPDLVILSNEVLVFIEAKFTAGNRTRPSSPGRGQRYTEGGSGWYEGVMQEGVAFATVAEEAQLYELLRMWLLGSWVAHRLQRRFTLVNLVRDGQEAKVEQSFGRFMRTSDARSFRRATWEGALRHMQGTVPGLAVTERLRNYMREKTVGYGSDRHLRTAFAL